MGTSVDIKISCIYKKDLKKTFSFSVGTILSFILVMPTPYFEIVVLTVNCYIEVQEWCVETNNKPNATLMFWCFHSLE